MAAVDPPVGGAPACDAQLLPVLVPPPVRFPPAVGGDGAPLATPAVTPPAAGTAEAAVAAAAVVAVDRAAAAAAVDAAATVDPAPITAISLKQIPRRGSCSVGRRRRPCVDVGMVGARKGRRREA